MFRAFSLAMGFLFVASSVLAQEASFEALGDLPGAQYWSVAHDVTADGSVVVGFSDADWGQEAFRWENGEMESLGDLPGGGVFAWGYGVSDDGSVTVGYSYSENGSDPAPLEAFRWENGTMTGLGFLSGGNNVSGSYDVSADGSVVAAYGQSANGLEAARWTAEEGMIGLGDFESGTFQSASRAVSADGTTIVGRGNTENGWQAFRWTEEEGMIGIGTLDDDPYESVAEDVSADGSVIVGYSNTTAGYRAFRWTEAGGMESLGDLPGGEDFSVARGISPDGSTVVGESSREGPTEFGETVAFIWTEGEGMRDLKEVLETDYGLDLTGWTLTNAYATSEDGTVIVGSGNNPEEDTEGWRVDLSPPAQAPENDNIENANVLTESGTYEGSNANATLEDDEPEPSCTFSNWTTNFSVWWSFTASGDGTATIDTNGSLTPEENNLDTILSLHNASDLSEVDCDDDGGESLWSLIEEAPVTEGETYLIRVAGYNESSVNQGAIQLTTDFQFGIADEATPEEIVEGISVPNPNPASGTSTFTVAVEKGQEVTVEVFDVTGRRVQTLYDDALAEGARATLSFDASTLPSGIYLIRAAGETFTTARRLTVVR